VVGPGIHFFNKQNIVIECDGNRNLRHYSEMDSEPVLENRVIKRKRCDIQGCQKSAQGGTEKCIEHGGGRRCLVQGCQKSAVGKTDTCVAHGGGRRCLVPAGL
jgi:hypothetical protein